MNTKDFDREDNPFRDRIFALFKGETGTGKSVAAGGFPNPFWEDLDRKHCKAVKEYHHRDYTYEQAICSQDVYNRLVSFLDGVYGPPVNVNGFLVNPPPNMERFRSNFPFETYVFDTVTSMGDLMLDDAFHGRKNPSRKAGWIDQIEIEDYGSEFRGFTQIFDLISILPCHVIVIAHVLRSTATELKKGVGRVTYESRTIVTGGNKISAKLPKYFDEVWHFQTRPSEVGKMPDYEVLTQHAGEDFAKTSLPLPATITWTKKNLYEEVQKYVASERMVQRL